MQFKNISLSLLEFSSTYYVLQFYRFLIETSPESVNSIDVKGYTPLHYAVKFGNEEKVKLLLEINDDDDQNYCYRRLQIGKKGHGLVTPFHYAKLPSVLKLLMDHSRKEVEEEEERLENETAPYNKILSEKTLLDIGCSWDKNREQCDCAEKFASICKSKGKKIEIQHMDSVFSVLLRNNDTAAVAFLDEFITLQGEDIDHREALIIYDFKAFQQDAKNLESASDSGNNDHYDDLSAHTKMVSHKSTTFTHPLSIAFLDLEVQAFNKALPWLLLRVFLFVLSLSGLAFWQTDCVQNFSNTLDQNKSVYTSNKTIEQYYMTEILTSSHPQSNGSSAEIGFYCLFSFVCINAFLFIQKEVQQALHNWKEYCKDYENVLEVAVILCTLTYLIGIFFFSVVGLKHAAAWSVFFAWIEILIVLSRIPDIGMYIHMFFKILRQLLKFMLVYSPGLVAFTLAFCILLPEVENSLFKHPINSIMKTFMLLIGEIGYEDFFEWSQTSEVNSQGSSQLLLLTFSILCCIVLMNLLVGLAVGEIGEEKEKATQTRREMAVKDIDRYLKQSNNSFSSTVARLLHSCFRTTSETNKDRSCIQRLNGTNGVLKALEKEWNDTKRPEDEDFSWKICIYPNRGVYDENRAESYNTEHDSGEVFFYDDNKSRGFKDETSFMLSKEIIRETITWLKQKKDPDSTEYELLSKKLDELAETITSLKEKVELQEAIRKNQEVGRKKQADSTTRRLDDLGKMMQQLLEKGNDSTYGLGGNKYDNKDNRIEESSDLFEDEEEEEDSV